MNKFRLSDIWIVERQTTQGIGDESMCRNEYEQVCTWAEGMHVILEFPAGREWTQDKKNSGRTSEDREQVRQEIREILTGVLLNIMEPPV